ncbi:MAG TPA: hypothetical protein VFP23_02140 [Solirubrobacterales bacterium]|nr:hypothetical protein [Solirubrobacterales bacterium]
MGAFAVRSADGVPVPGVLSFFAAARCFLRSSAFFFRASTRAAFRSSAVCCGRAV